MPTTSDGNEDVASVYIRLVSQESQQAAAIIEQISTTFGAHVALRVALIVILVKMEVQHYRSIPEIGLYIYLLKDSPNAVPFLKDAITACLKNWEIPQIENHVWEQWQQTSITPAVESRDPFEDLLQRIAPHNPITAMKLEQIRQNYGLTAGCYAATALIWLEARDKKFNFDTRMQLVDSEMRKFTYFQYMHEKPEALEQFIDMFECYRMERQPGSIRFE